jgi:hypothetical protein
MGGLAAKINQHTTNAIVICPPRERVLRIGLVVCGEILETVVCALRLAGRVI